LFLCRPIAGINPFFLISISILSIFTIMSFLPTHALVDFNFDAVGDYGCNSNTDDTVDNIDGRNPEVVFALGDYSYQSTDTCWFNAIAPIDSITKISIGNHEDYSDEGFSAYVSHFGLSQTYYSYNYQNVHVLVMDTDRNSYSSGSSQYNFVVNDLQTASQNPNIKWIIVYLHKPFYTSPNSCSSSGCTNSGSVATSLRDTYGPKLDQFGVDLLLQGHVHNYQRIYPIKYDSGSPSSPTVTDSASTNYIDPQGEIFAIVGTGGINFHALSGKSSFVKYQQDDFFGVLDILITDNGNKLVGQYYTNGGNKLDEFSITKANSPPVANNQAVTTNKNTAKPITLTATDPNNDPLTYTIVTQPAHGTITGGTGASRTYTPNTNYVGPDSFTFKANDGKVDSNTATVSINVQDLGSCATNLPISGVTASGNEVGNVPSNVLDGSLSTRWASNGIGQFITADLGSINNICSVDIAWYNGNARQYHFVIATSTDGTTFTNKFSGDSSGTTLNSEKYVFSATDARYVRVTVNGNTANTWASITELDVFGSSSSSATSLYNYGPSLTLSGR
jgi:Bacterial Ig domain/F5/8 type C domain/Calcineurin-like phosphoesterase